MNTSSTSPRLHLLPVSLRTANVFVLAHHHRPVQAAKFALAVTLVDSDLIRGVAIVGRPVARHLDDGWTREVTRLCTDSTPNADTPSTCAAPNACGRRRAARTKGSTRMPIDCCRAREARPC